MLLAQGYIVDNIVMKQIMKVLVKSTHSITLEWEHNCSTHEVHSNVVDNYGGHRQLNDTVVRSNSTYNDKLDQNWIKWANNTG